MTSSFSLSVYDYIIFVGTLVVCTLIGIYYGCFGNKQSTLKEYLLGSRTMSMLPIAVSLTVSHFSGSVVLVTPAEVFRYGASIWIYTSSFVCGGLLAGFVLVPVLYNLEITSIYEYLEKRFDRKTRMLAFIFYVLSEIMFFPLHVYSPSLTFSSASGVNLNLTAFILGGICIFYTTLGGLRTVVWTDFFQFIVIVIALVSVYVIGLNATGGFVSVWNTAKEGQRLDIFNFSLDITQRDTFWGYCFGGAAAFVAQVAVHQSGFQKYVALSKFSTCIWSFVCMVISYGIVLSFMVLIGLETFAAYKDCDPLTSKKIAKHDELLPYFLRNIAESLPGMSGLFIAAVCAASLSSMSSNLNAFCAVMYKDLVSIFLKKQLSEQKAAVILKYIVAVVGIISICLVFVVERLGNIISVGMIISGIAHGPLLGVFLLGVLCPRANTSGAFYGLIGGALATAGIVVPGKYYQMKGYATFKPKPLSTAACGFLNQTSPLINPPRIDQFQPNAVFRISFHFYTLIGAMFTVIIGLLISYMTKPNVRVDKKLINPFLHSWLPKEKERDSNLSRTETEAVDYLLESCQKE